MTNSVGEFMRMFFVPFFIFFVTFVIFSLVKNFEQTQRTKRIVNLSLKSQNEFSMVFPSPEGDFSTPSSSLIKDADSLRQHNGVPRRYNKRGSRFEVQDFSGDCPISYWEKD